MKRAKSSEEPRKRTKLNSELMEDSTFIEMVTYPSDLKVVGKSFEIPVHGVLLFLKSESLKAIVCQPGNSDESIWKVDESVPQKVMVQFLMNFYPGQKPEFMAIQGDYQHYYTLVDMHLGLAEKNQFEEFLISRIKHFKTSYTYNTFTNSSELERAELVNLLNLFCKFDNAMCSQKEFLFMYTKAIAIDLHLDFIHVKYCIGAFARSCENYAPTKYSFGVLAILLYIAMKNNQPFESIDLSNYPLQHLERFNFPAFIRAFERYILEKAQNKLQAYELFGKACRWITKKHN